jgi:hypothetical protein
MQIDDVQNEKKMGLLNTIIYDFGGISFLIATVETCACKIIPLTKGKFKIFLKIIRFLIVAFMPIFQIYLSVKKWKAQQKNVNIDELFTNKIKEILEEDYVECYRINLSKQIFDWLIKFPKTSNIEIQGYFNKEFISIQNDISGLVFIQLQIKNYKFMISGVTKESGELETNTLKMWSSGYIEEEFIQREIMKDFIYTYDLEKNVIEFDGINLIPRPRRHTQHIVTHFPVDEFLNEIERSKDANIVRSYLFSGPPGSGKTDIINKIEQKTPGKPIIIARSFALGSIDNISYIFEISSIFDESIIIFEDIDTYDLSKKSSPKSQSFLEGLDSTKRKVGSTVIATSNCRIHETFMRRGRIDKVYFIDYPSTLAEVKDVMNNRMQELDLGSLKEIPQIDKFLKDHCIGLSRADLCEIINHIKISGGSVSIKSIRESRNELDKTIESLNKIKYDNENIDDDIENDVSVNALHSLPRSMSVKNIENYINN